MAPVYAHDPLGLPAVAALIVDGLAVFRLVRLIIADRLADRPRKWLTRRSLVRRGVLAYFLTCPWCVSIWVAAGVLAGRLLVPAVWAPIAVGLALSALVAVLMARVGD